MQEFHPEHYPKLKQVMMRIGQDLSIPDFQIIIHPQTKAKETRPGSAYTFKISLDTPDDVSEEEVERYIDEKDWQKSIIEKLCEYYPDAKEVENGVHIPDVHTPGIGFTISVPDTIFSKYSKKKD